MKRLYFILFVLFISLSACDDYLDKKNLDTFDESNFWTSEGNMRLFAQGAYTAYFTGYGSGYTWGNYFTGGAWSDEYSSSSIWTQNTATSGNGWSFTYVRRANLIISRVDLLPEPDETKDHWRGIGRFFRAMEYADLARAFGDVPWYDSEVQITDTELSYKQRDPLEVVATKIMEDFQYAAENVRIDDGAQQINRDVVLAFMSRHLLYFGTFMKYHGLNAEVATTLLQQSVWAAGQLIDGENYQVADDYRGLFTSEDLSGNPLLWEIRRERCVELMFEGFRRNDLRRWKKYEYLKTAETNGPTTMGKGAYVDLSVFDAATLTKVVKAVHFYYPQAGNTDRAFIYNLYDANMRRDWIAGDPYYERQYLNAVPLDQIKLYRDLGYELSQNPGWDAE